MHMYFLFLLDPPLPLALVLSRPLPLYLTVAV